MRDFSAAIELVFAIEGMLLAGFTETMRNRTEQAAKRRRVCAGLGQPTAIVGVAIV